MVRKKKIDVSDEVLSVYNDERLVSKKDKEQLLNKPSGGWPKVNQGSHLTVLTYEDGRTELKWDDEALMRDVQAALATVGPVEVTETKPKKTRKKKE